MLAGPNQTSVCQDFLLALADLAMSQLKRKLHLKLGEIQFAAFEAGCRDSSKNAARTFF
jgi:hypothetical protein